MRAAEATASKAHDRRDLIEGRFERVAFVTEPTPRGTRAAAEAANSELSFGDLQGYYVVPVGQFQGFKQEVGDPGDFALVSAFRTEEGAQDFAELAATFGYEATILPERVRSLGGLYAGLGQEANLDGSGPLLGPIAESLP